MTTEPIQESLRDGVCLLRMNRPEARNALNPALLRKLADGIEAGDNSAEVRAFVITGGASVFSAGADVSAFAGLTAATYTQSDNRRCFDRIRNARKPVVAAVSGFCLGGGCEIAFGADLILATDTARFGQPEIKLGIIPGAGGTQLWNERGGAGIQARAALLGDQIDGFEARRLGLVDRIVPAAALEAEALRTAARIAAQAPLAITAAKAAMRARWAAPLMASLDTEMLLMAGLMSSQDAAEGVRAFQEKRAPRFEGN
jgi:enoyl-CoA hydratase/carnithine racemase